MQINIDSFCGVWATTTPTFSQPTNSTTQLKATIKLQQKLRTNNSPQFNNTKNCDKNIQDSVYEKNPTQIPLTYCENGILHSQWSNDKSKALTLNLTTRFSLCK